MVTKDESGSESEDESVHVKPTKNDEDKGETKDNNKDIIESDSEEESQDNESVEQINDDLQKQLEQLGSSEGDDESQSDEK